MFFLRFLFPEAGEAYLQVREEAYIPIASGRAGRSPDDWQTGWVNLRTVAGAVCGTHG